MNQARPKLPLGLRTIAVFEAVKGVLAVGAGAGVLSLRHTDLHAATDAFLLRHHINPERHYTRLFIESFAKATNTHASQVVALCFAYALIRFAEAYGLWNGKHWAEWFAVISAGLYLPLELQHVFHQITVVNMSVMIVNAVIVLYLVRLLGQQREERTRARAAPPEVEK
jgi:uncharacterized membrane protein (DUF2068 family)